VEATKTFSEVYLPAEHTLINQLFNTIRDVIKEKKKIPFLDSDNKQIEDYLEYFLITESVISCSRRGGTPNKYSVKTKELRDALKLALRTDEEINRKSFNKLYGTANLVGAPLYMFISLVLDEIAKHKVVGLEIDHSSFGKGTITKMELQKNYLWFKYNEDYKKLSMDYFSLDANGQQKINEKFASAVTA
jgi:hypothetical protein